MVQGMDPELRGLCTKRRRRSAWLYETLGFLTMIKWPAMAIAQAAAVAGFNAGLTSKVTPAMTPNTLPPSNADAAKDTASVAAVTAGGRSTTSKPNGGFPALAGAATRNDSTIKMATVTGSSAANPMTPSKKPKKVSE